MFSLDLINGIAKGFYPERKKLNESKLDEAVINAGGNATRRLYGRPGRFQSIVDRVNTIGEKLKGMSEQKLREKADSICGELITKGLSFDMAAQIFALVREFAELKIGMRHFDVQLIGGWVLLNGMIAEMETGEGKTLTATLPACAAALAGIPVHVITVNDYLAKRDAEWMRPIYESFGLSVGIIIPGMSPEDRRKAYRCDITYCTNKEIVFDYLKDRLLFGQQPGQIQMSMERLYGGNKRLDSLILRGLSFAIIDEADSVLIDEARTPLIISGAVDTTSEAQLYHDALTLADQLKEGKDFLPDIVKRTLDLTEEGKILLKDLVQSMGGMWKSSQRREELVRQALMAQHLFFKDKDYLIKDNKIQIIDEYTGRLMADRSWEQGLHQILEAKEGCKITAQKETLARISYQRFFRRYHYLAGMTGTAREVANEMWSVYRLNVVPVPTHEKLVRRSYPGKVFRSEEKKWDAVVKRIIELNGQGRPVLVGTRSVAASEHLGKLLTEKGLRYRILNARQDHEEAEIISQAGQKAQITVATNMAGRGTDIALGPTVVDLGGLHVIATEYHDARRIDRQLFGRCGRQGEPGSFECIASLEDEVLAAYLDKPMGIIAKHIIDKNSSLCRWIVKMFIAYAQYASQRKYFYIRRELLKFDESLDKSMSFSGSRE